jgi:hypothetical protein
MENFDDLVQAALIGSPWTDEFEALVAANPRLQAAIEAAEAARRARTERHDELCERLTPAMIDALPSLAPKMPHGEPISIHVGWNIRLALSAKGVTRENDEDILF